MRSAKYAEARGPLAAWLATVLRLSGKAINRLFQGQTSAPQTLSHTMVVYGALKGMGNLFCAAPAIVSELESGTDLVLRLVPQLRNFADLLDLGPHSCRLRVVPLPVPFTPRTLRSFFPALSSLGPDLVWYSPHSPLVGSSWTIHLLLAVTKLRFWPAAELARAANERLSRIFDVLLPIDGRLPYLVRKWNAYTQLDPPSVMRRSAGIRFIDRIQEARRRPLNSNQDQTGLCVLVLWAAINGSAWIARQIRFILDPGRARVRIVVRDDDPTDGTRTELECLRSPDGVSLAPGAHRVGSAAQNFLMLIREQSADTFEPIALSDQDDVWYPRKLSQACGILKAEGSNGYSSATMARWENGKTTLASLSGAKNRSDFLFEGAGQSCKFVMTVSFYRQAREFTLAHPDLTRMMHFHDWALYALARSWGLCWSFDSTPSMIYCQHPGTDTGRAAGCLGS